LNSSLNSKIRV